MPVLRQRHARNFTTLPNELLQDPRLTCGDLGLLVQMLSRPENWGFSTSGLNALYRGRTGKESIAKSVKRLREAGLSDHRAEPDNRREVGRCSVDGL